MDTYTNISPCHFTACLPSPVRVIHRLPVRMYAAFSSAWRSRVDGGPELCAPQVMMAQSGQRERRNGWERTRHSLPGGWVGCESSRVRTWSSPLSRCDVPPIRTITALPCYPFTAILCLICPFVALPYRVCHAYDWRTLLILVYVAGPDVIWVSSSWVAPFYDACVQIHQKHSYTAL